MATYKGDDGNNNIAGSNQDDKISGGGGDDKIRGFEGRDLISGGMGNDKISGGMGNDRIYGGGGDDMIFGGRGDDTAQYRGNISEYTYFVDRLGRLHINDTVAGRDGNDTLQTVEHFQFGDGSVYDLVDGKLVKTADSPGNVSNNNHDGVISA